MWIIGATATAAIIILPKILDLLIGSRRPEYMDINDLSQNDPKISGLILFPFHLNPQLLTIRGELDPAVLVRTKQRVGPNRSQCFRSR
jgi:hypothetical protein